MIFKTQRLDP